MTDPAACGSDGESPRLRLPETDSEGSEEAELSCMHCGEPESVELFECWGREFLFETCCEGLERELTDFLNEDPKAAAAWFERRFGMLLPDRGRLRRVSDNGTGNLILDYALRTQPVAFAQVRMFVEQHHRHSVAPRGWRFGCGVLTSSRH